MKKSIETIATPAGAFVSFLTLIIILFAIVIWQAVEGKAWALVGVGLLVGFILLTLGAGIAILSQHVNAKQDERLMMVNAKENAQILNQQFRAQKELTMAMVNMMRMQNMMKLPEPKETVPGLPELPDGLFDDL